ncbi:MAG: sporulation protein YqfD [Oscillospiraceae bacterium]|nr:sporulation protein YqfD [Oscillospiraceae bacterium]
MKRSEGGRGLYLGSVEFSGIGGYQEKFISELLAEGVKLRRVRISDGMVTGMISPLDYSFAAGAARTHGVRLRAGKRKGLYFSLLKYSRRSGLYAGFLIFCLILSIGQATVADIRIDGDVPTAQVIRILEECGIERGVSTHALDLSQAERRLLLELPEAAWVDVSVVGYRVTVTVKNGTAMPEMLDESVPCNIVSTRDAVVVDTVVRKGKLVTEIGSGVQRGGLLVSGTVADGGEHLLYKHASADIIGEFTETREFFVPYNETIRLPDGETTEFRYLVYMEDVYPLFLGEAYVEDALYSEHTEIIPVLGEDSPFRLKVGTFTKYREVDVTRSDDDCIARLKKLKEDFEENFYPDFEIVSAWERLLPEEDGLRLAVDYTLRGNIAQEQPIEVELTDTSDEENTAE